MPKRRDPFEIGVIALFALLVCGGFLYEVAVDFHPLKLGAVFLVVARVVLLVVHEVGHAVAARMVGARVRRLVVGYGTDLLEGEVFGVPFTIRAWPVEGFVSFEHGADALSRGASAFTYAAGVGAEALFVLPFVVALGTARLFTASDDIFQLAVQAAAIEVCLSALSNLLPHTSIGAPGERDGLPNDGLGIVRSLFGARPS